MSCDDWNRVIWKKGRVDERNSCKNLVILKSAASSLKVTTVLNFLYCLLPGGMLRSAGIPVHITCSVIIYESTPRDLAREIEATALSLDMP